MTLPISRQRYVFLSMAYRTMSSTAYGRAAMAAETIATAGGEVVGGRGQSLTVGRVRVCEGDGGARAREGGGGLDVEIVKRFRARAGVVRCSSRVSG